MRTEAEVRACIKLLERTFRLGYGSSSTQEIRGRAMAQALRFVVGDLKIDDICDSVAEIVLFDAVEESEPLENDD